MNAKRKCFVCSNPLEIGDKVVAAIHTEVPEVGLEVYWMGTDRVLVEFDWTNDQTMHEKCYQELLRSWKPKAVACGGGTQ